MKHYKSLCVVIHLLMLLGTSKCDISTENQTTADVRSISSAQNSFGRDFYLALAEENEGNLFFSPFSLSAAFGMLQMGSQGNTEAEVKDVFYYPENKLQIRRGYKALLTDISNANANYTLETVKKMYLENTLTIKDDFGTVHKDYFLSEVEKVQVNPENANANYTLETVNKMYLEKTFTIKNDFGTALKDDFLCEVKNNANANYTLETVNKMYLEKTFTIKNDFGTALKDDFLSEVKNVSFRTNPEGERIGINDYVEEYTNSKIKDLIPEGEITEDTKLVLVNAVYFKAIWEKEFNKSSTLDKLFWVNSSNAINVSMMKTEDYFYYAQNSALNAKILKLDYKGKECAFYAILPYNRNGLHELEGKLSSINLQGLERTLYSVTVNVQLPKFALKQNLKLKPYLKKMGLTDAFNQTAANFSSISDTANLYVSGAFHNSFIEVDEEGSEAAAATAIVLSVPFSANPIQPIRRIYSFIADHPFLFFIKHTKTNSILFAGRVMNPN